MHLWQTYLKHIFEEYGEDFIKFGLKYLMKQLIYERKSLISDKTCRDTTKNFYVLNINSYHEDCKGEIIWIN
jgi:hypothetical protein